MWLELFQFLALAIGIPLAVMFLQLAWTLATMPEWRQRELRESYERRQHTDRMIRFWLSGGKVKR